MPAHGLTLVEVGYPPDDQLAARAEQTRASQRCRVDQGVIPADARDRVVAFDGRLGAAERRGISLLLGVRSAGARSVSPPPARSRQILRVTSHGVGFTNTFIDQKAVAL